MMIKKLPLLRSHILFAVISISSLRVSLAEPPEFQAQQQIQALKLEVQQLQQQKARLHQQIEKISQDLKQSEIKLLLEDFQPKIVQSMQSLSASLHHPKAQAPLVKKRAQIRYMKQAQDRPKKKDLNALLEHSPVLIALWATWCKPCVSPQEQAYLQKLKDKLQKYGIPLVSIGVDQWSKIEGDQNRWFYPLWHIQDAHLNLTPEVLVKEVGMGLPLFFLRLPDGAVPYYLPQTLSDESVEEWVTLAIRAKLAFSFE